MRVQSFVVAAVLLAPVVAACSVALLCAVLCNPVVFAQDCWWSRVVLFVALEFVDDPRLNLELSASASLRTYSPVVWKVPCARIGTVHKASLNRCDVAKVLILCALHGSG